MIRRSRRSTAGLLTLLCFLNLILSCSYSKPTITGDSLVQDEPGVEGGSGIQITGYVTKDGVEHSFEGHVRLVGSQLHFAEKKSSLEANRPDLQLPRSEVPWLLVQKTDSGRTVKTVFGSLVLTGILVAASAASSCPFIYSFDGAQYVFDGEPYGGSISRGLERTDWSELQHLRATNGEYRLLVRNELDETQHMNSLELWVVDHPSGTRVALEEDGTVHAFSYDLPLQQAREGEDTDITRWLLRTDHAHWHPDLTVFGKDPEGESRQRITLEFERPATVEKVYLLANVSTGHWGSHMLRRMLDYYGDGIEQYYAALDEQPLFRQMVQSWQEREDLFHLSVYVQKGETWQKQTAIPGGGPYVSETRAIPLDLHGIEGERVRIQLEPPIGFWSLNSFHLAWGEARFDLQSLRPRAAVDANGNDVVGKLLDGDEQYLHMPTRSDEVSLVFPEPPPRPQMHRTLFASTRGWYRIHLRNDRTANAVALQRLRSEPGALVSMALEEYADFHQSGRLQGVDLDFVTEFWR